MLLTLVPLGGLCNRLRLLLSALGLAGRTACDVVVAWGNDPECGARFDQLFEAVDGSRLRVVRRPWWAAVDTRRNLHLPWLVRRIMGYTYQACSPPPTTGDALLPIVGTCRRAYVASGFQLSPYGRAELELLKPLPRLQARIDSLTARFAEYTVGVHIRRTDNARSIAGSPVAAFRRAMEAEMARHSGVVFFLATDDGALKQGLLKDYPGRIIAQVTDARRDNLQGMEEAVVDLWCLAATKKLLASYWSSFSDTAAELGGIPMEVVRGDPSPPPF